MVLLVTLAEAPPTVRLSCILGLPQLKNVISGFHYLGPESCVTSVGHNIDLHSTLIRPHSPHESGAFIRCEEAHKLIVNL